MLAFPNFVELWFAPEVTKSYYLPYEDMTFIHQVRREISR